ncbi:PREDICTED: uncharacterized protein LOC109243095 [Nicotiana attenuata]|uniref:uncharacterized protein LOC109243095 n=1 Tax=Nicotiana attenuata TaxID=49451 RepID=UPI000904F420|nr:PREDICTED: uncharacterized protein LOC109243095 [Nicotiana attenuata]
MWNKYCKKEIPTVEQFRRGSKVWRKTLNAREKVELEILWELKSGTTNIWHENWTGLGILFYVLPEDFPINEDLQDVAELRQGETWDDQLLDQTFNEEISEHIRLNVHLKVVRNTGIGHTGCQLLQIVEEEIATGDIWRRQGQMVMSWCWCCQQPHEESIEHIFITSPTASNVWKLFMGAAGITVLLIQLKHVIKDWWYAQCCPKLKPLFQAVPTIITWELWKRRNAGKHGGSVSTNRVIHEINRTLHQLARVRYAWMPNIPLLWPDIIQYFEGYKPILITTRVTWQLPFHGWYKCNTNRASKGNPGPSSLGFYVRNDEGDVVYARAVDLGVRTNVVAEAKAIIQGLEYCVEHDLHSLILETDSLVMKKVIEGEWDPPRVIANDVKKIREEEGEIQCDLSTCVQRRQLSGGFIASIVFSFASTTEFHSLSERPSVGRGLINLDKSQTPNLRVRIAKRRAPG